MIRLLRIAWYEYSHHVFRWRFLINLFFLPIMLLAFILAICGAIYLQADTRPFGFLDPSGTAAIDANARSGFFDLVTYRAYPDLASLEAALARGEIQAYYLIPASYPQDRHVQLIYDRQPVLSLPGSIEPLLVARLLADQPPEIAARLTHEPSLTIRSADGKRELSLSQMIAFFLPLMFGLMFISTIFNISSYLVGAFVEEREHRTLEILLSSVTSWQLAIGKTLGVIAIGITRFLWEGLPFFLLFPLAVSASGVGSVSMIVGRLLLVALVMVLSLVMVSGLVIAGGTYFADPKQAHMVSGLILMPVGLPYYFFLLFMTHPSGPLARALSFFPLTAPISLTMRITFTDLSLFELALNLAVLLVAALATLWLAGTVLRKGMLRIGRRRSFAQWLRWKQSLRKKSDSRRLGAAQ